jgi:hypothetical protein
MLTAAGVAPGEAAVPAGAGAEGLGCAIALVEPRNANANTALLGDATEAIERLPQLET